MPAVKGGGPCCAGAGGRGAKAGHAGRRARRWRPPRQPPPRAETSAGSCGATRGAASGKGRASGFPARGVLIPPNPAGGPGLRLPASVRALGGVSRALCVCFPLFKFALRTARGAQGESAEGGAARVAPEGLSGGRVAAQ